MTLSELCKEVLELDKQATKGPWAVAAGDSMLETSFPTTSGLQETITIGYPGRRENSEFIAHARNNYAKLALAAQRMGEALGAQTTIQCKECGDTEAGYYQCRLHWHAHQARVDVQTILADGKEGE